MAEPTTQPETQQSDDPGMEIQEPLEKTPNREVRQHFPATDDALAIGLLLSLIVYVGLDGSAAAGFSLANTNPAVLGVYLTIVGVACAWAFGKRAINAWQSQASLDLSQR